MTDLALLVLRLGYAALLLAFHGGPRFLHALNYVVRGEPWTFVGVVQQMGLPFAPGFAVVSALTESVGAVLLAAGLWTRPAAGVIAANMTVAAFHEGAKSDSIELPALYLIAALAFAVFGPGRWSVDAFRGSKKTS